MSWLARSLANSLGIDEQNPHQINHDDVPRNFHTNSSFSDRQIRHEEDENEEEEEDQSRGVKEDLSEFKESVTRQLLGVAKFLAPPPPPPPPLPPRYRFPDQITVSEFETSEVSDPSVSGDDGVSVSVQDRIDGENRYLDARGVSRFSGGDRFRSVPEEYQLDELDWRRRVVGVTDEVLAFAGNIAHHPETWLDFPVEEEDGVDDFEMSECQKEHAFSVECLTPSLKALRIELCPALLGAGYFWKVYFVLLHSRLNKHDAKLLSTSQVVEARKKWMQELQKRNKEELERQRFYKENAFFLDDYSTSSPCSQPPDNYSLWAFSSEPGCSSLSCDSENEKHPATSTETEFVDKSVIEEKPVLKSVVDRNITVSSPKLLLHSFDDDDDNDDDWPEDDFPEDGKGVAAIPLGIEEEVSFSDLEDDDCSIHAKYNISAKD